jgi:hypothetical protein
MSYTDEQVTSTISAMDKYRGGEKGEMGAALVVVGLSANRAAKEARIRDDTIPVAHRTGASLRQLAEALGRRPRALREEFRLELIELGIADDAFGPEVRKLG